MKPYKYFLFILLALIPLFILVAVNFLPGNFRPDAYKQAVPSFGRKNLIGHLDLKSMINPLIINLDSSHKKLKGKVLEIPARKIGDAEQLRVLRHHKGPVVLWSENPSVSARAWMLLSQLGFEKVYVLTDDPGNEVLKYKFRPDSVQTGI